MNPDLSDSEPEEHIGPESSQEKLSLNPKSECKSFGMRSKDENEIKSKELEFCETYEDENGAIQSERFLKMSHISNQKSNSTHSNSQYCRSIVNQLENENFSSKTVDQDLQIKSIGRNSEHFESGFKGQDNTSNFSFDVVLNFKNNENLQKTERTSGEVKIITSKIMPQQSNSKISYFEHNLDADKFVDQNIHSSLEEKCKHQIEIVEGVPYSYKTEKIETSINIYKNEYQDQSTEILRGKSSSLQSNLSQQDRLLDIDIAQNYSYIREPEVKSKSPKIEVPLSQNHKPAINLFSPQNSYLGKKNKGEEFPHLMITPRKEENYQFQSSKVENKTPLNLNKLDHFSEQHHGTPPVNELEGKSAKLLLEVVQNQNAKNIFKDQK